MMQTGDAIQQLCLMAAEALKVGDLEEASTLIDLGLARMDGTAEHARYRTAAQRFRGVVHALMGEFTSALALLQALRGEVPNGTDETRTATLGMIGAIAQAPAGPSVDILSNLVDEAISCLELCRTTEERTELDEAVRVLAAKMITAECSQAAGPLELARSRAFVDRLARHARGMTRDGAVAIALLLGYITTLAATLDDANRPQEVYRLIDWSKEHALWNDGNARYVIAHALKCAVDRLKTKTVEHKTAERHTPVSEPYREATRIYELIEQHYGSTVTDDVRMAATVAGAAHALLGADAMLARKAEATSRMSRICEIRNLHPAEAKLTQLWLDAPLRYVVALAKAGTTDEVKAEALRARNEAKRHMSKSDYSAWRKRMAESLKPDFLEWIGF